MRSGTDTTSELGGAALPPGVTPPSGAGGRFLSDVIVGLGFTDRETVDQALDASRAPGKKLGTTLVEIGALSERQLGRAVAERYRLDYLDLSAFDIDPEAVHVIGDAEMRRYDAVPVAFTEDGALVVAMTDPADWLAAEEMAQLTGRRIRRAVADPSEVTELIARVAEARSSAEDADGHGSAADGASTMQSRLMLRPVTKPLAGRALGKASGVDRTLSEGSTSEGRPAQVSTEGPAQRAGIDRAAAQAPAEAMELRVIPLTPRTVREEPATEGAEGALRGPAEASAVEAPLDPALENGAPPASSQDVPATGPLPVPASEATPTADGSIDEAVATEHPTVAESPAEELEADEVEREPDPEPASSALDPSNDELEADEVEREPDPEPASSALDPSNDEREAPDRESEASLPQEEHDSARSQTDLDDPEATSGDAPDAPDAPEAPVDAAEGAAPEQPVGPADDTSADPDQLEEVRADLARVRAELDQTHAGLARVRDELEGTRGELASVRSRNDGALERTAEAERLLAESRAQVGLLEAELSSAREQSQSLREDLSWARGQIEQQGQRENDSLAELRSHIEAMKGLRPVDSPPAAPSAATSTEPAETPQAPPPNDPPTPAPSRDAVVAPAPNGTSASGSEARPSPVAASMGHGYTRPNKPEDAGGTTKARGLKRLIAAMRRL